MMSGISSKAAGTVPNKKKFNGIEQNSDFDLNIYEAFYRNLDPQIGRFWQLDPKPSEIISLYAFAFNNPLRYSDPLGDTVGVDFLKTDKSQTLQNASKTMTSGKNDGVFAVFAHANSNGIQYEQDGKKYLARTPEEFNNIMAANSKEWKVAMKDGKEVTVVIYGCNAASTEYFDSHFSNKTITTETPIAQKISAQFGNLTVVAADGYVTWSQKDEKTVVTGVIETSDKEHKNTGKGGFITYKDGEKISKIKMASNGTLNPDKGDKKKF